MWRCLSRKTADLHLCNMTILRTVSYGKTSVYTFPSLPSILNHKNNSSPLLIAIPNNGPANPPPTHLLPLLLQRPRPHRRPLQEHPSNLHTDPPPLKRPILPFLLAHQPLGLSPDPHSHVPRPRTHHHPAIHSHPRVPRRILPRHPAFTTCERSREGEG